VVRPDGSHLVDGYFNATNCGKRSVEIDLESPDGRAMIRKLATKPDVVIENFKGGLARYGLDCASLSAVTPGLLLGHAVRAGRALCAPTGLRLHDPGHERDHVADRRTRG
jgi:crotonobetainyl-CoA:carnitine CoA-transferase CaiB-like acyl-CoA transferase